jgi:hypothetical protein
LGTIFFLAGSVTLELE